MRAEARHGKVQISGAGAGDVTSLTRDEAFELIMELADAYHKAGDISDGFAIMLSASLAALQQVKEHGK